jgi:hypothetical protein
VISGVFIVFSALAFVGSLWAAIEEGIARHAIPWRIVGAAIVFLAMLLFWLLL